MRYPRLLWSFFRISSLREIQYRANFFIQALQSLVGLGTGLAGLGVVFAHTTNLGGWKPPQLLAVLGVIGVKHTELERGLVSP